MTLLAFLRLSGLLRLVLLSMALLMLSLCLATHFAVLWAQLSRRLMVLLALLATGDQWLLLAFGLNMRWRESVLFGSSAQADASKVVQMTSTGLLGETLSALPSF